MDEPDDEQAVLKARITDLQRALSDLEKRHSQLAQLSSVVFIMIAAWASSEIATRGFGVAPYQGVYAGMAGGFVAFLVLSNVIRGL